ncbi:MAG: transcriptional repressor [Desulfuromonadales bacterium]|nr:transcriptional repressor [Desulfuromonadales bacterium]MBN2792556.1 transcriptional repressor [Desulfuromonadales bacterium]
MSESRHLKFISGDHDHQRCMATALANAEQVCLNRRRRFTALRRRVFELIWQQHKPIGAYEVLEQLQKDGRAAPPTVYRALDFLLELGLVHRIASMNAYVGCVHPERQHEGQFLICMQCRAFAELDSESITRMIDDKAQVNGFEVHRHTIEILGLCPKCQAESEEP